MAGIVYDVDVINNKQSRWTVEEQGVSVDLHVSDDGEEKSFVIVGELRAVRDKLKSGVYCTAHCVCECVLGRSVCNRVGE